MRGPPAHKGMVRRAGAVLVGAVSAISLLFSACTQDDELPPAGIGGSSSLPNYTPCRDGAAQDCGITLGEHNNVLSCYLGAQTCTSGVWGACLGGQVVHRPGLGRDRGGSFSSLRPLALTEASDCQNNPCDPSCQLFDEQPDAAVVPSADADIPVYEWVGGTLLAYPAGLSTKGLLEPCQSANDCQFNFTCSDVATSVSCTHSKCETGIALDTKCDTPMHNVNKTSPGCVEYICLSMPECCEPTDDACAHDVCIQGNELGNCTGTNACVAAVCALDSTCCKNNGSWDSDCVTLAKGLADPGEACASESCITTGSSTCADGGITEACPDAATIGATEVKQDGSRCYALFAPASASSALTYTNALSACQAVTGGGWSLVSVGSDAENTVVKGLARTTDAWIGLHETNEAANTFAWADGTSYAGTPPFTPTPWASPNGDSNSNNHVMLTLAGKWQLANDGGKKHYVCEGPATVTCNGGGSGGSSGSGTNTWSQACVNAVQTICGATCTADSLVKHADGDRWGAGTCEERPPGYVDTSCAGVDLAMGPLCTESAVPRVPVCNHGQSTFSGSVLIEHYPANSSQYPAINPPIANNKRDGAEVCMVSGTIPAGECLDFECPSLSGNREVLINPPSCNDSVVGGTPCPADVAGNQWTQLTECNLLDNWTLFSNQVSDCQPPSCGAFDSDDPVDCAYDLPSDPATYNPADISITAYPPSAFLDGGASSAYPLARVATAGTCGTRRDAFYVTNAQVVLCPTTCTALDVAQTTIRGSVGCPVYTVYQETTYTQTYGSTCDLASTNVQWGYLAYDATLPAGTTIELSARTAATEAELSSATYTVIATADPTTGAVYGAACPMSGPSPCPIDLFTALGGLPSAHSPFMELKARLIPSASTGGSNAAPTLNSWEITFSCVFNQ